MGKTRRHRAFRLAAVALAVSLVAPVARGLAYWGEVGDLARHDPQTTALIRQRAVEAAPMGARPGRQQRVVPYSAISPYLKGAVVAAEDRHFLSHHGIDLGDLKEAIEIDLAERRLATGGSSITQQLAKNLFLGTDRSVSRKITELVIALQLEARLPKTRILELYLNNIEWGRGVYGCEAASRTYFRRPAARLTAEQAIRLASIIPNPLLNTPSSNSIRMTERRKRIAAVMYRQGYLRAAAYRSLPFCGRDLPGPEQGGRLQRLLRSFSRDHWLPGHGRA